MKLGKLAKMIRSPRCFNFRELFCINRTPKLKNADSGLSIKDTLMNNDYFKEKTEILSFRLDLCKKIFTINQFDNDDYQILFDLQEFIQYYLQDKYLLDPFYTMNKACFKNVFKTITSPKMNREEYSIYIQSFESPILIAVLYIFHLTMPPGYSFE